MSSETDTRTLCKYGAECYQKNAAHHKKFRHPSAPECSNKREPDDDEEPLDLIPKKKLRNGEVVDDAVPSGSQSVETSQPPVIEERLRDESQLIIISKLPTDAETKIKTLFLVDMPEDFYDFYKFCETLPNKPVRKSLSSVGLELVGPFDVLGGNVRDCTREQALRHYRYFYDPPEFQTVLKSDESSLLHFGYFRDDPSEMPSFVACSSPINSCKINIVAGNLFGTLANHIEKVQKTADPFRKMQIQKIQRALAIWAKNKNVNLDTVTPEIKSRKAKVLTKTFHGAGLVVPFDKKADVGYREPPWTEAELRKILKGIAEATTETEEQAFWGKLTPLITNANIANDESDFGTSLELGLALFSFGSEKLHAAALQLMTTSYELLNRPQYSEIIKAHLQARVVGPSVNTIS